MHSQISALKEYQMFNIVVTHQYRKSRPAIMAMMEDVTACMRYTLMAVAVLAALLSAIVMLELSFEADLFRGRDESQV